MRHDMAIIELTTKVRAVRRSKIAFWVVALGVGVTTAVIGSAITSPIRSVLIGLVAGLACGFIAGFTLFCWPALRVLWHWAAELLLFALVLAAYSALADATAWQLALLVLATPFVVLSTVPALRRRIWPWVMCAVTRHRLRVCFRAFLTTQRFGYSPLILLARPIPAGERVWVWLRTGLALSDLEQRLDKLATGCWAADCRITPASNSRAALVRVDVIRRNPLKSTVESPLPELVPAADLPGYAVYVPSGLDLPDVTEPPVRAPKALTSEPAHREPTVSDVIPASRREADDLSDWI
jgi:hypothetical protein